MTGLALYSVAALALAYLAYLLGLRRAAQDATTVAEMSDVTLRILRNASALARAQVALLARHRHLLEALAVEKSKTVAEIEATYGIGECP